MPLTDFSDLYARVHEDGINNLIAHVRRQRPSLFNYGTPAFTANAKLLCEPIVAHPEVVNQGNPLVAKLDYLPIPGYEGPYGIEFFFQLTSLELDFHPGNKFSLPPELNPPLAEQRLALAAKVCAGIPCPDPRTLERLVLEIPTKKDKERQETKEKQGLPFDTKNINCFCLEIFGTAGFRYVGNPGDEYLDLFLGGLEVVDIKPTGLENSLECYVATALKLGILPKLRIAVKDLVLDNEDYYFSISPSPISANIPFNPSIRNDAVHVYGQIS